MIDAPCLLTSCIAGFALHTETSLCNRLKVRFLLPYESRHSSRCDWQDGFCFSSTLNRVRKRKSTCVAHCLVEHFLLCIRVFREVYVRMFKKSKHQKSVSCSLFTDYWGGMLLFQVPLWTVLDYNLNPINNQLTIIYWHSTHAAAIAVFFSIIDCISLYNVLSFNG